MKQLPQGFRHDRALAGSIAKPQANLPRGEVVEWNKIPQVTAAFQRGTWINSLVLESPLA
jgi:hypothetical protein